MAGVLSWDLLWETPNNRNRFAVGTTFWIALRSKMCSISAKNSYFLASPKIKIIRTNPKNALVVFILCLCNTGRLWIDLPCFCDRKTLRSWFWASLKSRTSGSISQVALECRFFLGYATVPPTSKHKRMEIMCYVA